jgi:cytochrome P450
MFAVAVEFDSYIRDLLTESRKLATIRRNDAVTKLLRERIEDRALSDEEIVSILRNWTMGELSTISACVGILTYYLAERPHLQQQLREQPNQLLVSIDDICEFIPHSLPAAGRRRKRLRSAAANLQRTNASR